MKKADIQVGEDYAQSFYRGFGGERRVRVLRHEVREDPWTSTRTSGIVAQCFDQDGAVVDERFFPSREIRRTWAEHLRIVDAEAARRKADAEEATAFYARRAARNAKVLAALGERVPDFVIAADVEVEFQSGRSNSLPVDALTLASLLGVEL